MNDTERIVEIIKEKGLTNVQFCNLTGISAASLSHITSGRSNPTLAILRSVIAGFPDLNPEWVFQGTGSMYKSLEAEAREHSSASRQEEDAAARGDNMEATLFNNEQSYPEFNFAPSASDKPSEQDVYARPRFAPAASPSAAAPAMGTSRGQGGAGASAPSGAMFPPSSAALRTVLADTVRETVAQLNRPKRRIVEVRVFFDDGTYESFSGTK